MDDPKTQDLVRELVLRLLPPQHPSPPPDLPLLLRYAHRLLSSRLSPPSLPPSSPPLADSIARLLVLRGRPSLALSFHDLHSRLLALPHPPSALLLLLSLSSPNSASAAAGAPLPSPAPAAPRPRPPPPPSLTLLRDPDNLRHIAFREYLDIVRLDSSVPESALVRDLLYALQGVDGKHLRFSPPPNPLPSFELPPDSPSFRVPRASRTAVRLLAEPAFLFRIVRDYVLSAPSLSTVQQAFCSALQDELDEYYRLLAVLESHAALPIPPSPSPTSSSPNPDYLSLRRLAVWLAEPTVRLRLMAVLVDSCGSLAGGAMAGAIHEHSRHGDPIVQEFMRRLLSCVCVPLFEMVRKWVLGGELEDVFGEFFIVGHPVKAELLWREGYSIRTSMLPSFISQALAQRILRTGKSINFLRVCCEDIGWVEAAADVGAAANRDGLAYGETDVLETMVAEAAKKVDKHLMHVIHQRYRFRDHCLSIKRYLLLGQGDFVQYLMDVVGPQLSDPANTLSSFQLTGLLETAIRASNAQYDDRDILDRLKVRMIDHVDGDRGWDVFSLDYDARIPLDTVFSAVVMKRYLRIFNFLWKLKRVEHALIGVWKTMKPNRINANFFGRDRKLKSGFVSVMRRCQVLWNEMNHFVTNFQYYIMFEVLEVSWACFSYEMDNAKDLDDLLAAHDKYLESIVEKSLLGEKSQAIFRSLFVLFDLILRFRSSADRWFEFIYELQTRGKSKQSVNLKNLHKSKVDSLSDGGRKVFMKLASDFLPKMSNDLDSIAKEYSTSLEGFISQLPLQQHVDLKFLLFRLDFTEYYSQLLHSR